MKLFDRLRALLGLGCRRLRVRLGLPADRRTGRDRRDAGSPAVAAAHGERLARERWTGAPARDDARELG